MIEQPAKIFVLLLACLGVSTALVSGEAGRDVDSYIHAQMAQRHIPGVSVAVIWHGRLEKLSAYGYANAEFSVPMKTTTLNQVASITKSFAAVAVMMLIESGKARLDGTIGTYVEGLPASWQAVTVRQLLNHTSGLPDVFDYKTGKLLADTAVEAIRLLGDRPLDFPAGTRWSYNQTNYMLLQAMVEKISSESFERFCHRRLFAPLHMSAPVFGGPEFIGNRAMLYTRLRIGADPPRTLERMEQYIADFRPVAHAVAGLNMSAADFAEWLIALMDGRFISRASLEQLWAPEKLEDGTTIELKDEGVYDGHGLGWWRAARLPHSPVGGSGGDRSAFFVYPEDDLAVIVLTNLMGSDPDTLADHIGRRYLTPSPQQPGG